MKRLNLELLATGLIGILAGIAILATAAWDYCSVQSLPPLPATARTIEELKGMHLTSLKFIVFIAAAMILLGLSALSNLRRRRKVENTK